MLRSIAKFFANWYMNSRYGKTCSGDETSTICKRCICESLIERLFDDKSIDALHQELEEDQTWEDIMDDSCEHEWDDEDTVDLIQVEEQDDESQDDSEWNPRA